MWTRRRFLAVSAGVTLAACSGGDDQSLSDDASGGFDLIRRFPDAVLVPGEVTLPFSLGRSAQLISDEREAPAAISGQIRTIDGEAVADVTAEQRIVNPSNPAGKRIPFYVVQASIPGPGFYQLVIEGGTEDGAAFQINDPASVVVPLVGSPMPASPTPTVDDAAGVDPICTRDPACPFHEISLDAAVAEGRAIAYLIGTPAYCSTGVCGPQLEQLIELAADYGDRVTFIHAEVYTDDTLKSPAPAVEALSLSYEPVLFTVKPDGTVAARLDAVFDQSQMKAALDAALS